MNSFDISDENIVEEHSGSDYRRNEFGGVQIVYGRIDPTIISDGVDGFEVVQESENRYRIVYSGYATGYLRVTRAGLAEFSELFLTERGDSPSWFIDPNSVDENDLPRWIPDSFDLYPESECDRCEEVVLSRSTVTPFTHDDELPDSLFCQECWEEMRDEYEAKK